MLMVIDIQRCVIRRVQPGLKMKTYVPPIHRIADDGTGHHSPSRLIPGYDGDGGGCGTGANERYGELDGVAGGICIDATRQESGDVSSSPQPTTRQLRLPRRGLVQAPNWCTCT